MIDERFEIFDTFFEVAEILVSAERAFIEP